MLKRAKWSTVWCCSLRSLYNRVRNHLLIIFLLIFQCSKQRDTYMQFVLDDNFAISAFRFLDILNWQIQAAVEDLTSSYDTRIITLKAIRFNLRLLWTWNLHLWNDRVVALFVIWFRIFFITLPTFCTCLHSWIHKLQAIWVSIISLLETTSPTLRWICACTAQIFIAANETLCWWRIMILKAALVIISLRSSSNVQCFHESYRSDCFFRLRTWSKNS